MTYALMTDEPPPPRRRGRVNWPVVAFILVLAGIVAAVMLRPATVSERARDEKTVRVVLPPPPPLPPPPEVQPVERPPEPTPTPMDQPVDEAPPPPDAASEPTAGDNALTAREGAGPSNYGLARGDGSGRVIGGRPGGGGGGGYGAYGGVVSGAIQRRLQSDPATRNAEFGGGVNVWLDADGRIERIALARSTGDPALDAALMRLLRGTDIGQAPPADMPQPIRLRIGARSGR